MANRKLQTVGVSETLVINEIYLSVQGESTWAGLPCVFVRLTACNLRCSYCDTAYAFTEGKKESLPEMLEEIRRLAEPYKNTEDSRTILPLRSLGGRGEGRGEVRVAVPGEGGPPTNPQFRLPLIEL